MNRRSFLRALPAVGVATAGAVLLPSRSVVRVQPSATGERVIGVDLAHLPADNRWRDLSMTARVRNTSPHSSDLYYWIVKWPR